ncbi:hypothetical protein [Streptomyces sp. NPDC002221]|uniref:hypothetical protein n=1 Tax=Streptomyces sp. NPDC002221 TaxID=3364639 RepID=UPI003692E811
MWSRPRGLFFWLCLILVLFTVAMKPVEFAHTINSAIHDVSAFFNGLHAFLNNLGST